METNQFNETEMIVGYRRMWWNLANKFCRKFEWIEPEELVSEAAIAFVEASKTFDPSIPVPFGIYARKAATRRIWAYIQREYFSGIKVKKEQRRNFIRNKLRVVHTSINREIDSESGMTLAETIPQRERAYREVLSEEWWQERFSLLTDRQKQVVEMTYRECLSQMEISRRLGIFQSQVWQTLQAALKRMQSRSKPKNTPQKEDRRKLVAEHLRSKGPLTFREIHHATGIPLGSLTFVLDSGEFKKVGSRRELRFTIVSQTAAGNRAASAALAESMTPAA